MPTREYIEERMVEILDRNDLSKQVSDWFRWAHRSAQRRHNFLCMQYSAYTGLTSGQTQFEVPLDFKNAIILYVYDPFNKTLVREFVESDIGEVRGERVNPLTYDSSVYALWNNVFEIDPPIGGGEVSLQMRLDYYAYIPTPALDETDHFTEVGEDYLIYAGLAESAPFLGADSRLKMWEARALVAWTDLKNADIEAKTTGSYQMRG